MRVLRVVAVVALAVGIPIVVGAPPAGAATHTVSLVDSSYSPASLNVQAGDTVTWTNNSSTQHTVTADGGAFASGTLNPGQSFSHTFIAGGSFAYHCEFHGSPGTGMAGTIVVAATPISTIPVTTAPTTIVSPPVDSPTTTATIPGSVAPPAPELARTGSSSSRNLAALGVVFLALGTALARRRR